MESLAVLAADAQTQAAWLDSHGVMADEIALDFDHAFRMADALVAEGRLSGGVMAALGKIDAILSGMSDDEITDRWTTDALSTDAGWAQTRCLARRVLAAEMGGWRQPLPRITVVR
ncbi:hypothetical protein E4099_03110 [Streptomyces palmae]|uniref:Uncharacterized protein n=1 Tax=Streptomyces palmae TaxID=1701085 RepID=A0A4Z0HIZ7_9ACTN|nr:hypothetical protein E4099_03110 [Streptomyces palmae]